MAAVRELQEEANVSLTVNDLHPFAHWVTPEVETPAYDTRFFRGAHAGRPASQARRGRNHRARVAIAARSDRALRAARAAAAAADLDVDPPAGQRSSIDDVIAWARRGDRPRDAGVLRRPATSSC